MTCSSKGCVVTAGDDVCGSCLCPDGTPTCGSVFGPECNKDNSTLYVCSRVDALPSTPTKCAWGCDIKDGPDKCNTDCLCKNGNDVCGSVFPSKCGYKSGALYKCSGALADPSAPVDCAWGCVVKAGPDMCNADCLCKDTDDVCGSDFPDKCGYTKDSLYKCSGKLADPSSPSKCKWGCDIKPGSDKCNTDCLCKDKDDVCGSIFPAKCNLQANSLYKCSGALADPSSPVVCTKGCDVKDGPDNCNTDCLCKDKDDVCGSAFPTKCGLRPNSLYKCSGALADPLSPVACTKGCDVKDGPDKCNTDCLCKDKDDVCGSVFPAKCNLQPNSLYKCSGALADPSSPVVCTKGCDVKDGPDICITDCLCKNGEDVCGSQFPTKCGLRPNSLYKCPGALADPSSPVACTKGCDVKDGPDKCNTDCLCKNGEDVCGSEFPPKCNLQPNSLYKCSGALADPSSPVVCTKGCDVKDGPDKCNIDCLCKNGEDVCGSVFPAKCNLQANSLYKCSGALADPSSPVVCTKGCDVKDGPDNCNTDCLCKDKDDVCGSAFPTKCGLRPNSLYKCSGALADPLSPVACTKGCDVKDGPDKCNTDCLCKDKDDVCGSVFPAKCGLRPNSLYKCSGALADPSSPVACTKGCDVKDGPDKCNTDCLCKNGDDVCGSQFPSKCNLQPDSLYKCSGALADPSSPVVCTKGCDVKDGPDNCNTDCLCKDKDDVCGSVFPTKCGLRPNSLYKCSGALADPSSPVACTKGCDVKDGPDMCNADCLCKDKDDVCGSAFPAKCGFEPNSLYKCSGALANPSTPQTCTFGPCLVIDAKNDICTPDPCLCTERKKFCSNASTSSCGFSNNTILECTATGAIPQVVEKCRVADTCVEDPVKGPECKCMPVESGQIINLYSSKCVAVEKLAVGEPVVIMNCSNEKAFKDWHIADGKIKTYDNQFCFGYTLSPVYDDGNPIIAYPCHGGENQQWILPSGWGCREPRP
ncbi:hypothetical protein EC991_007593 [Linnemannia zychae]|nr:hypothetical protein EC991_007593 [Linnemannia zychae]